MISARAVGKAGKYMPGDLVAPPQDEGVPRLQHIRVALLPALHCIADRICTPIMAIVLWTVEMMNACNSKQSDRPNEERSLSIPATSG